MAMAEEVPTPPGLPFVGNSFDVDSVDQTASLMRLAELHGTYNTMVTFDVASNTIKAPYLRSALCKALMLCAQV